MLLNDINNSFKSSISQICFIAMYLVFSHYFFVFLLFSRLFTVFISNLISLKQNPACLFISANHNPACFPAKNILYTKIPQPCGPRYSSSILYYSTRILFPESVRILFPEIYLSGQYSASFQSTLSPNARVRSGLSLLGVFLRSLFCNLSQFVEYVIVQHLDVGAFHAA